MLLLAHSFQCTDHSPIPSPPLARTHRAPPPTPPMPPTYPPTQTTCLAVIGTIVWFPHDSFTPYTPVAAPPPPLASPACAAPASTLTTGSAAHPGGEGVLALGSCWTDCTCRCRCRPTEPSGCVNDRVCRRCGNHLGHQSGWGKQIVDVRALCGTSQGGKATAAVLIPDRECACAHQAT